MKTIYVEIKAADAKDLVRIQAGIYAKLCIRNHL